MNNINLPVIKLIDRWLGPKVSALIIGIFTLVTQYSQFSGSTIGLPFDPSFTETLVQFFRTTGLVEMLPAPIAALLTYYFRRAPDKQGAFGDVSWTETRTPIKEDIPWQSEEPAKPVDHVEDIIDKVNDRDFRLEHFYNVVDEHGERIVKLEDQVEKTDAKLDSHLRNNRKKIKYLYQKVDQIKQIESVAPGIIKPKTEWPLDKQEDLEAYFGKMGSNQTTLQFPYPMKLSWDTDSVVTKTRCHEKVAESLEDIFTFVKKAYTPEEITEMGLDLFGGCLNVRLMRSSDHRYSTHSWGIAVDLDPDNNRLRWQAEQSKLAKPEYEDFWKVVESTGAQSSGRVRNFDFMHFQFARFSNV